MVLALLPTGVFSVVDGQVLGVSLLPPSLMDFIERRIRPCYLAQAPRAACCILPATTGAGLWQGMPGRSGSCARKQGQAGSIKGRFRLCHPAQVSKLPGMSHWNLSPAVVRRVQWAAKRGMQAAGLGLVGGSLGGDWVIFPSLPPCTPLAIVSP